MGTGKCFSGLDESRCSLLVLVSTMMLLNHWLNSSNIRRSNILSLLWIWLLLLLLFTKFQTKANRMQIYPRCIADQITVLILFDHSSGRKLFGWLETALIPFFLFFLFLSSLSLLMALFVLNNVQNPLRTLKMFRLISHWYSPFAYFNMHMFRPNWNQISQFQMWTHSHSHTLRSILLMNNL